MTACRTKMAARRAESGSVEGEKSGEESEMMVRRAESGGMESEAAVRRVGNGCKA